MSLGLRARILLIAGTAMLLATGAITALSSYVFTHEYTRALESRSLAIATGLKVQLERLLLLGIPLDNLIGFEEQAQEAVKAYEGVDYAMVVAPDGRILFHSKPERMGRMVDEPEVLSAVRSGIQVTTSHDHGDGQDYATVVPVMDAGGSYRASIVLDVPSHVIASKANRMLAFNAGIGLLFLLLGLGALVITLSALVTNPLQRLIRTLQDLRASPTDLSQRAALPFVGEMGKLVETFDGLMQDLERTTASKAEFQHAATHDALTGLANRILLQDRLEHALAHARRNNRRATVVFIDLDHFKVVNDSLGHELGDALLKTLALRLTRAVREVDTVARFGGDEFVILFFDLPHLGETLVPMLDRLHAAIAQPVRLAGREYAVTPSMGFATFPQDGTDAETLLRNADGAMYRAKELGRDNYQSCSEDLHTRFAERLALCSGLRQALERDEFQVYYQPQVDLATRRIVGVEALVRWQHPERGMILPERFISAAEETGLIQGIGEYVLRTACAQAKAWQTMGLPLRVAVNLSPRQFWQPDLPRTVEAVLLGLGLDPRWLELELTECLIMRNPEEAVRTIRVLRSIGVSLAIDDFGMGYSSLSSLKSLPIGRLKIAQQFLPEIPADPDSVALARAVIGLGHSMKLGVIAEGVETAEQLRFLADNGCDEIQGYLVSRPVPPGEIPALVRRQRLELPDPTNAASA